MNLSYSLLFFIYFLIFFKSLQSLGQGVKKSGSLDHLPPILILQFNRFSFNINRNQPIKVGPSIVHGCDLFIDIWIVFLRLWNLLDLNFGVQMSVYFILSRVMRYLYLFYVFISLVIVFFSFLPYSPHLFYLLYFSHHFWNDLHLSNLIYVLHPSTSLVPSSLLFVVTSLTSSSSNLTNTSRFTHLPTSLLHFPFLHFSQQIDSEMEYSATLTLPDSFLSSELRERLAVIKKSTHTEGATSNSTSTGTHGDLRYLRLK